MKKTNYSTRGSSRGFFRWLQVTALVAIFALINVSANAQVTVTGAVTGNGSYTTLGAAITAIGTSQAAANINIAISGNTTEGTATIAIGAGTWTTMTIQPTGGSWTITAATTAGLPMIDFNGADNVTINGLNLGGNALTISNTTVSATSGTSTLRFQTDATSNTITNCSILGSATMAVATNGGNIWFGSAAVSTGNDNNTVSNCNIGPAGANLPTKCIYFSGSSNLNPGTSNSGITINNNNIFDYFGAAVASAGIDLNTGTATATITNNRFYQSATRTQTTGAAHRAISINNSGGDSYTITGNTIGYANSAGTGTYNFVGVSSSSLFIPIFLSVNTTNATIASSNTITNIAISGAISGTSSSAAFRGIYVSTGLATCNSNTIGSQSATGAITYTSSSASTSDVIGIFNFGTSNWTTNNNTIGGITASNSSTGASNIYGIRCNTGSAVTWTCTGNTIGGTVANSINSTSTATGTIVNGILNSNPIGTFTGNTIRNMTVAGGTGTGSSAAMVGIAISAASANHTVGSNTIFNLSSSLAGASVVSGINFSSSTGTNTIEKNLIYGLDAANTASTIHGINIIGGTATYRNNMIRLGSAGNSATVGMSINGINETTAGIDNLYHNSIYIGGAPTTGASNSFAFQSSITLNTRDYRNNIFFNARSNSGSTGKHYAIRVGGTAASPSGLTSNYNCLFANGTGGFVGLFNAVDQLTIANWRTATGNDLNSFSSNPQFVAPTAATPDLHLNSAIASACEAGGILIASVTDDFDGQTRSGLTPTDVGADALNGTPLPLCAGTPAAATINGAASVCSGSGTSLTLSTTYTDLGITYQWASSTTPGGPYSTTLGTGTAQATGNLTTSTYYICTITCTNSGLSFTTTEKSVLVNTLPTVAVTPNTGSICSPGGSPVNLTASGASTYAWSPAGGLSATTGANVSANPTSTTTYTVTGTDGNGCTNTATAAITVSPSISLNATATPSSVCSGNNSQLNVVVTPAVASATNTIKITEVCLNRGGTGAGVYPAFATGADLVEITNISSSPVDISGWALQDYASNTATVTHTGFTFPASTIIPANSVAVVCLGTGTNDVANRYYNTGGTSDFWLSSGLVGIVLKNGATVIDAVGCGSGYVFNAGSGVVATDWSGFAPSASGLAGTTRIAAIDNNIGTDWSPSSTTTQTIGVFNAGYTAPVTIASYAWSPATFLSSTSIANPIATAVTAGTTYAVTVTTTGGCTATTNVTVNVASGSPSVNVTPAGPVSLCGSATQVLTANASGGGQPYTYAWTLNGSPIGGNTATLTASAAGSYVVTVTDFCGLTSTASNAVAVTVNPFPTATATASTPVCAGGNIVLNVTTATGTSFAWTGPNTYSSSSQNPTITGVSAAAAGVYSVVVTGPGGCTVSASTAAVVVNPAVTSATATSPATVCAGGTVNLTSSAVNTQAGTGYTLNGNSGVAFIDISGTGTSVGTIADDSEHNLTIPSFTYNGVTYTTARVGNNGVLAFGSTAGDINYSNRSLPAPLGINNTDQLTGGLMTNVAGSTLTAICANWDDMTPGAGGSITTQTVGNVYIVQWTNEDNFDATGTGTITFQIQLNLTTGQIHLVYSDITYGVPAFDGAANATVGLNFSASSALQFSNLTASLVDGQSITFTPNPGPLTYAWTASNNGFTSTAQNPTGATATAPSTTYTVVISNVAGCTASATATTNVSTVAVSSTPTSPLCNGASNGSATFSASGGVGPYTFTFNGSPAASPVSGLAAGTYAIVATDANGCTGTGSVTVAPTSAVSVSGAQSVAPTCYNSSNGAITFSATGGTAGYTYTLNGSPATSPASGLAGGSYTVVATDANGCTGSAVITVTAPAAPTLTASNDGPVCEGATITLTATGGFTTYAWTGPVNGSGNPFAISSAVPANSGSYSVLATDANGCTATASTSILVNPSLPASVTVTVSPSLSVCAGSPVTFTANPTNGGASPSYQWYLNNTLLTGETNATYVTSSLATGNNDVYVVLTSNALCATGSPATAPTVTVNITGSIAASVSLTGNSAVCAGGSATYTATATGGGSTPTFDFYLVGNPTPVQSGASNTYTFTPGVTSGIYVVMTSSFACASGSPATSNTVNTVYNTLPTAPVISVIGSSTACAPGTVTLASSYTGAGNTWNPGGATTDQIVISAVGAANYTVTYTDGNGCSSTSAPQTIAVYATNTVSITPANPSFCIGGSVVLTSSNALGNVWSTTETTQSITVNASNTYSVINTNENGCTATASVNVVQNDFPVGSVSGSTTLCFGTSNLLTANYTVGNGTLSYAWSLNGTPIGGATSSTYSATAVGSYTVVVTSSTGCSVTSDAFIIAASGPLSGTYTIGSPASCTQYTSIANFIAQFNALGVAGPVILNVPAGYTETAPVGGFALNQCALGAGLRTSATNTLIIQKSGAGANPLLTGAVGTSTTTDGIFFIVGSDYVTVDGINVQESASNLTATTQNEFGYALVKCDGTNGAQNNTIKNCSVTLNRTNPNTFGIFSGNVTKAGVALTVTATSGGNSNNSFTSNTISNSFFGIYVSGFGDVTIPYTFFDQNNSIGAIGQGNTITTFGRGTAAATDVAIGIYSEFNNGIQIRGNTITASGHSGSAEGIRTGSARWANVDITNNTISGTTAGASGAGYNFGILSLSGNRGNRLDAVTNTVNITNNTIQNLTIPAATTGDVRGIMVNKFAADSMSAVTVNISNNTYQNNTNASTTSASTFANIGVLCQVAANTLTVNQNIFLNNRLTGTGSASNRMIVVGTPGTTPNWNETFNITNNDIQCTNVATALGAVITGIAFENYTGNSMASGTINITGNAINGITQSGSVTGAFNGIVSTVNTNAAFLPSQTLNLNNNVVNGVQRTSSTTGAFTGITNTGSPLTLNATGNQVTNNSTGTGVTGTTHAFNGLVVAGSTASTVATITNNQITGNTHNGTGTTTLLSCNSAVTQTITGNTVSNNQKTTIAGSTTSATMTCLINATAAYTLSNNTVSNNRILGASGTGVCTINGIINTGGATAETITNNNVNTLFVSGSTAGLGTIFGMRNSSFATNPTRTLSGNQVYNLYTTSVVGTIRAIRSETGGTVNIRKNKVYDIYPAGASATAVGVSLSSGNVTNVENNYIGLDQTGLIATPTYTGSNAVIGLEIANSTSTQVVNSFFNTIRLAGAPGSGVLFGSSGISVTNTFAPPILDLRNNIVVNLMTPGGSAPGFSVAYRRATVQSSGNYAALSNNNLLYAGTPGTSRLIYFDGTNSDQTIAAFKARGATLSPVRDGSSVTENVNFASLVGSATGALGFLHISTATPTVIESGGQVIATITDDYDGDVRNAITPDIGADENNFINDGLIISNLTASPSTTASCTNVARLITVTYTLGTGAAPVTSSTLNYSLNGGASIPVTMTTSNGTVWSGTIPTVTPANATVTYTVTGTDGTNTSTATGVSYKDEPFIAAALTAVATPASICAGSSSTIALSSSAPAPVYTAPPAVSAPTTDEDFGSIVITQGASTILSNTTAGGSLVGTIGTATGTAGSYSNFTAFGPYTLNAGTLYNFALTSITQGGNFGNSMAIYIDYNRNGVFTDAGELVYAPGVTITGPHTETGSFTVPVSANNGVTRMRVICNEGLITSPTQFLTWGEYEEYSVRINSNTYGGLTLSSISWSDGTNTVGSTASITQSPAATTTYTATLTTPAGCTSTVAATVTVNPIPTAPTTTPSTQCGVAVPTASVTSTSGLPTPGFNWYLAPTGGTPVQSSTSTSLTAYSISTTTTFYVSEISVSTGCESARTPVLVTVNTPDVITASSSVATICLGQTFNLSVSQTGSSNVYAFTWNGTASPTSGLTTATGTTVNNVQPTAAGTYVYTVNALDATLGCATSSTVSVTVVANPVITSVTANPAGAVCAGTPVVLTGTNIVSGPQTLPSGYLSSAATSTADEEILNVTFGTINQSSTCLTTGGAGSTINLYSNYTAITPATVQPNQVVPFSVQVGTCGGNFSNRVAIFIDWNRDGDFLDANENPVLSTAVIGPNTVSGTITVPAGATVGLTMLRVISVETTGTILPTGTYTWGETEDYSVNVLVPGPALNWSWNNGGGAGASVTVTPSATTNYTVTATNPATGCSSTASLTVTVNPLPSAPTSAGSTQCGAGIPTAAVASSTPGVAFNWYLAPTGGTPIQSSTSATLTAYSITTGTTFYVSAIDPATSCQSARTPVTVIVNIPDVVTASSSASAICLGQSFNLTATQTGSTNTYVYTWNGTANSGLTTATGSSVVGVTPTAAGSYTYTNTAVDAGAGCTFISTVTVTVSANPVISSVTASPAGTVCAGTAVTLTGSTITTGPQTPPTYAAPGTTSSASGDQIVLVQFNTINNASGTGGVNGFVNYIGVVSPTTVNTGSSYNLTVNVFNGGTEFAGAWIDWNRNGVYETSEFYNVPLTLGTDWTGTISVLVPPTASAGVTGIRVRSRFAAALTSADALLAYTFGETEDYAINVQTLSTGTFTWSWNPGALSGASVIVNPTATTTYTVTATNTASGCTSTAPITINVNPLPSAPTATPSTQCGVGVPTATVASTSGAATPAFNWYLAPSGGTPIQSSTSTSLTTYSISTTTSFFVAEVNPLTSCESPRTTVTVTVNQPDVVTANTSAATICLGQSFNLSLTQTGSTNTYAFTWNGTASATSGLATTTGNSVTGVTPTAPGTYIYTLTAVDATLGCTYVTTVSVTVNALPTIFAATASASSVCAGTSVTLSAFAGSNIPAPTTYCATTNAGTSAITNVTINTLNRTSGAVPLSPFYESVPEATATTSLVPGTSYPISITTDASAIVSVWIDFNRDGIYDASEWVQPFTSGISGTSTFLVPITASSGKTGMRVRSRAVGNQNGATDACLVFGSGETEDYTVTILSTTGGTFAWTDGTSTISTVNPYTFIPTASGTYFAVLTGSNGCSSTSAAVPVTVISTPSAPIVSASTTAICISGTSTLTITNPVSGVTYQWAESTTLGGTYTPISGANGTTFTTPTLTSTNYYQVTATCGVNSATSVSTGIIVSSPIVVNTTGATRCGGGSVTISATGTGSFNWYNVPSGGTILFTGASYSPIVSASTTFYVEAFDGTCFNVGQGRVAVAVTVTPSTPVTISATPNTVCLGGSTTITAASTNTNYSYSWSWNGGGSATGASFSVTPTITRYYVLTATDGACQFIDSVLVTVNQPPSVSSVTATPSSGCVGITSQLLVSAAGNTSAPAPTTYCAATNAGSAQITNVTFNTINSSGNISVSPFYISVPEATATTTLLKGQTYPFTLTLDGAGITSVWIDYNRDGVYDATEWQQVYLAATTGTINITIPLSAGTGKTGMRVRSRLSGNQNGAGDACLAMGSGETEDYTVTLAPSLSYAWTPTTGLSSSTIANPVATFTLGATTYNVVVTDNSTGCFSAVNPITITGTSGPSPIITDLAGTPIASGLVLCAPGNIDLYAKELTGPYAGGYPTGTIVTWLGYGISGDPATTSVNSAAGSTFQAQITLAGSGCIGLSNTVIIDTRSITVTPVITPAACGNTNGKVKVTVSTAPNPPYRYQWLSGSTIIRDVTNSNLTDSITNLAPGTYTLNIYDNVGGSLSCSTLGLTYVVSGSTGATVNADSINVSCFGLTDGSATANIVSGGTAPFSYLWSTGGTTATINGLGAGLYTVTVTDGLGCTSTATTEVLAPAEITAVVTSTNACFGQSNGAASVVITGGSGIYTTTDWYNVDFSLLYGSGLSVTSLPAGTLNLVIVDNAGCSPIPAVLNPVIAETAPISVTSFAPSSGAAGSSVVITGSGFTGATSVSFNGTPAIVYTVDNDLQITATVPTGATTGVITVNVGQCSGVSGGNFMVISTGTLNLKAYIQGYLDVLTTTMTSVILNQTGLGSVTETDNITVEFHNATAPYALAASSIVMLNTNGTATVTIPGSLIGGSYYIAIIHRSALETWSANPVALSTVTNYDFTTSSSQAFGDNMVEGPTGVWSLYTGDVDNTLASGTQDGLIDLSDFLLLDTDVQNFIGGYVSTDLNGNGIVDLDDFLIQDANVQNFIGVLKP